MSEYCRVLNKTSIRHCCSRVHESETYLCHRVSTVLTVCNQEWAISWSGWRIGIGRDKNHWKTLGTCGVGTFINKICSIVISRYFYQPRVAVIMHYYELHSSHRQTQTLRIFCWEAWSNESQLHASLWPTDIVVWWWKQFKNLLIRKDWGSYLLISQYEIDSRFASWQVKYLNNKLLNGTV